MKIKGLLLLLLCSSIALNCSKQIEYTSEFMNQTSGKYLYNPDDIIEVYYDNEELFLKWRGAEKIKPVVLDKHTFFVADMYKKLRFVEDPKTKKRYLSILPENSADGIITYNYLKVPDAFKTVCI